MGLYVKIGWQNGCERPESIKQWLVAPSCITPAFISFEKSYLYNIFFINWCLQIQVSNNLDEFLNFSVILKCYYSKFIFFLWSRLPKYVNRSTLNLIAHEMTIALPLINKHEMNNPHELSVGQSM
jgi:hypothetical protein